MRNCILCVAMVGVWLLAGNCAHGAEPAAGAITTLPGAAGDLLRRWHAEGTAAGNIGDWYDNRDRGHSELNLAAFPQLRKITYTPQEVERRADWAGQTTILPRVVIGNSSTAASVLQGGSNVRAYYSSPNGLAFLHQQYRRNNLYIYPEHRDHDPGRNGRNDGYGDVFPANTPYLIASQGSSGSDRAFLRAVACTLAAFRPEVKQKLTETGLLMPTVQMILRRSNKHLADEAEYLTGKAHPTVFEGAWIDELKMVTMAHAITLDTLPPLVQLQAVADEQPASGRDYFEVPGVSEKHADTPGAIARIFHATGQSRRIVVSAAASVSPAGRPLKIHWAVLRGDAQRVRIRQVNPEGAAVEIAVLHHDRRPVAPGATLESNRVDIGAFVHDGVNWSAPAFVTFFFLDNEARTYDPSGRILEVGYGMGESQLRVSNWKALLDAIKNDPATPGITLLRKTFKPDELALLGQVAEEYAPAHAMMLIARENRRDAAAADQKAAQQSLDASTIAAGEVLDRKRDLPGGSARAAIQQALNAMVGNPVFCLERADALIEVYRQADAPRKAAVTAARKRLSSYGLLKDQPFPAFELTPLRSGDGEPAQRLTEFEVALLRRHNADILAGLLLRDLVAASHTVNYVDPRLVSARAWRDVYRHDSQGNLLGWIRYTANAAPASFTADGHLVERVDAQGRCLEARSVGYQRDPADKSGQPPLRWMPGDTVHHYAYSGDEDLKGSIVRSEQKPKSAN